jgi:hypothetical protein
MKHRFLPVLLLVFFPLLSQAQKIEIGINVAPTISHRFSQPNDPIDPRAESIRIAERPMHTFDFGIDVRSKINNRLKIGSALIYSQKGFANTNLPATYDNPDLNKMNSIDYVQDYLEIPLFATYDYFQDKKINAYALAGINNSLLFNAKNNLIIKSGEVSNEDYETLTTPYLQSSKIHNIGMIAGTGVLVNVNDKTAIGLEAQTKFMFTPLEETFFNTQRHLFSMGLNFRFIKKL